MNRTLYDSALKHLTEAEVNSLITDYSLNNSPAKELIGKYKINATPKELPHILPPVITTEMCPYCNVNMYTKVRRSPAQQSAVFCLICNHQKKEKCNCEKCKEKRERKKAYEEAKHDFSLIAPKDISDMNKYACLALACLLFAYFNEKTNILYIPKEKNEKELLKALGWLDIFVEMELLIPILSEDKYNYSEETATEFNYYLNLLPESYDSFAEDYINRWRKKDVSAESILFIWTSLYISIALQYVAIICPRLTNATEPYTKLNDVLSSILALKPISFGKLLTLLDRTKEKVDAEASLTPYTEDEYLTLYIRTLNNVYFLQNHEKVPSKEIPPQLMTSIPTFFFSRFCENINDGYTQTPRIDYLKECYQDEQE